MFNAEGMTSLKLPNSIGHLSKLAELRLGWKIGPPRKPLEIMLGSNETLSDTVCNLRALEVLDIGDCKSESMAYKLGDDCIP